MPSPNRDETMDALEARAGAVTRMLKLLANEKRILVLCRLAAADEMTVTALAAAVNLSPSALSQHLARMRNEGLVGFRRETRRFLLHCRSPGQ